MFIWSGDNKFSCYYDLGNTKPYQLIAVFRIKLKKTVK